MQGPESVCRVKFKPQRRKEREGKEFLDQSIVGWACPVYQFQHKQIFPVGICHILLSAQQLRIE
mgnify:CR=1 FL=1